MRKGGKMPEKSASDTRHERDLPAWAYLLIVLAGIWIIVSLETSDWNTYRVMDNSGWIEHEHDTPVWIEGEWLPDEYRDCEMSGKLWGDLPESAHLLCGIGDPKAIEGKFHVLPVHYWGRIDRTDRTDFSWRCQKETSGLECRALN
jgi:hypothetical protein